MKAGWRLPAEEIDAAVLAARSVEVVLVEFDGPQVVSVWGPDGAHRLAVACDDDATAVRWVDAELTSEQWSALFEGKLSLHHALLQPRLWIVDETRSGEVVRGWELPRDLLDPSLLPDPGALLPSEVRRRYAEAPRVAPAELRQSDAAVTHGLPNLPRMVA